MEPAWQRDGVQPVATGTWDHETDLLVVGSTAISGGGVWIPNNHLMAQAGIPDCFENARRYMQNTVGDRTPRKNQEAFVTNGREMLEYLAGRANIEFRIAEGFSDYYPERPGGVETGRTVYVPWTISGCCRRYPGSTAPRTWTSSSPLLRTSMRASVPVGYPIIFDALPRHRQLLQGMAWPALAG